MSGAVVVLAAVEGIVDEAVIRRLFSDMNVRPGSVYGKNGKPQLHRSIRGYNNAARFSPWIVLVDLDQDFDCAPLLRKEWLPTPGLYMCFRIAVRSVEAWLLSDYERIAGFLKVSHTKIPEMPEDLDDPKNKMVNLARQSRYREIREDMVPRPGSGRAIGPAYSSRLIEFVSKHWRPEVARQRSDSLDRTIQCLERLIRTWQARCNY
ncbi:MAG TPA: hypothetical protein ENF70_02475 [Deltaproteobacteria bacterium]|nr:hypothetical protein [Deltaproteobacteria bacterium]